MAKYSLNVYNPETEEIEKTVTRNFIPVSLYIKFQALNEKLQGSKIKKDAEMFAELTGLFIEAFPELSKEDYLTKLDVSEVLQTFRDILLKATQIKN